MLQFLNSKVVQIEKQIELQPANTAEEKENKEFALKLFNFVQAKLEQKDDGNNTLTVFNHDQLKSNESKRFYPEGASMNVHPSIPKDDKLWTYRCICR